MKAFHEFRTYESSIPLSIGTINKFAFLAHWHNDVELVYVRDGELKMGVNKEIRILGKGDLAICSSGDIHYYNSSNYESDAFLMIFKPEMVDSKGLWPQNVHFCSPFVTNAFLKEKGADQRLRQIFNSILWETENIARFSSYFLKALVYELCGILLTHVPFQSAENYDVSSGISSLKIMRQALLYIEKNYTQDIKLEDIARTANVSLFYFSRVFNQMTGMNFRAYLNSIRIKKAQEMIMSDMDGSITDIAYECGFNSIRTFNRVFKAINGNRPTSMKRKQ